MRSVPGKLTGEGPQHAAFERSRIADQVEIGARFPPFALESLSALLGGHRRIRTRIGVRKDRIGILVERHVAGRGSGWRCACVARWRRRRASTTRSGQQRRDGTSGQPHIQSSSHITLQPSILLGDQGLQRGSYGRFARCFVGRSRAIRARVRHRGPHAEHGRREAGRVRRPQHHHQSQARSAKRCPSTWPMLWAASINGVQTSNTPKRSSMT